jgi:hypothetical protein
MRENIEFDLDEIREITQRQLKQLNGYSYDVTRVLRLAR